MTQNPISYGARLRQLAAARGASEAIRFLPARGGEQILSWAELDAMTDRFARALVARGAGQGDIVGFALPNVPAHLALALAIWRIGATTMVLDPSIPPETAQAMKARSGAALMIGGQENQGDLGFAEFLALADSLPQTPVADRTPAPGKIVLSGGSTGLPKMMCDTRPFARIVGQSWGRVAPRLGFRCEQTQLVCAAMSHNAPFTWAQNGLFEGNRLVLMEHFDAVAVLQAIDRFEIGFAMVVPTMLVRMIDHFEESGASLASLHALYHTGAPCARWLKQAWVDLLGPERVSEMYGSGENTGQTVISGAEWLHHPGSVGRGFETDIRIYGEAGEILPPGEVGEIFMRPEDAGGRSNYFGPDAPKPRRDADGFQSIGDLGWLDAEGYLYLSGRRDDVINTGGVKVHPETVEAVLLKHPQITDAVAFGIEDREWGQKVVAFLVAKPGTRPSVEALHDFCAEHLSRAETPKVFQFLEALPRDGFGKIRRRMLAVELAKESR